MNATTVLTARGNPYAFIRKYSAYLEASLALTATGQLIVANETQYVPMVMSEIAKFYALGLVNEVIYRPASTLKNVYLTHYQSLKVKLSNFQLNVVTAIADAARRKASDIHIAIKGERVYFKYRINGELVEIENYAADYGVRFVATLYNTMCDIAETSFQMTKGQEGRISNPLFLPELVHGVRIATTPASDGSLLVMRLLYTGDHQLTTLGFTPEQIATFQKLMDKPYGITIIAGPTGAGKSTTLEAIMKAIAVNHGYLDKLQQGNKINILSIEDPVEYPLSGGTQINIMGNDSGKYSREDKLKRAITGSLRLDPDVIMIAEVRDLATAQVAIDAATTGHMLWTTIHANSSFGIIERINQLGANITDVLHNQLISGLCSQRLLKVLCSNCAEPWLKARSRVDPELMLRLESLLSSDQLKLVKVRHLAGCEYCSGGIQGRNVVAEVIELNHSYFYPLLAKRRYLEAYELWLQKGGFSIMQHSLNLLVQGLVDPQEIESQVGVINGHSRLSN